MKSLFAALGLSLVLTFNAFAADTTIDHGKTNLFARPAEPKFLSDFQGKVDTSGPRGEACENRPCSTDSDCCVMFSPHCKQYGDGLYCRS